MENRLVPGSSNVHIVTQNLHSSFKTSPGLSFLTHLSPLLLQNIPLTDLSDNPHPLSSLARTSPRGSLSPLFPFFLSPDSFAKIKCVIRSPLLYESPSQGQVTSSFPIKIKKIIINKFEMPTIRLLGQLND